MEDIAATVAELVARQEIAAVIHRRARGTDQRDLELCLSCYHDDATEDHEGFDGPVIEYLRTASPVFMDPSPVSVCSHLIGNIEIEVDGDRARSRCYFICCLTADEGGRRRDFINAGRYLDDFERRAGRWAITRRECAYDWSRTDEPSAPWWKR